jgi:hypothetical protein
MNEKKCDLCVVGAGSGGFAASLSAARRGLRVLLVEAAPGVGGTSTWAGVNNYEPVAGATGIVAEVYERLRQIPAAVALQRARARYHPERPWGWYDRSTETDYRLSLSRASGLPVAFEPDALDRVMRQMLEEAGVELLLHTRCSAVETKGRQIDFIIATNAAGEMHIKAPLFVDATAHIFLARQAGCQTRLGPEGAEVYGENSASAAAGLVLNNASLCYRITPLQKGEKQQIQAAPADVDLDEIRPVTSIRTYPNGDLNMNPLGMMSGKLAHELGENAYSEACKRMLAHWHILQTRYPFQDWKLSWTSPFLGVREGPRLVGRYVLNERDIDAGLAGQTHEDIIAIADHAVDFHGSIPSREVPNGPYGVPLRCLLPVEYDNLLVACRGASFSSIAASSCRLSRTMMVLGQAAGTAAALFGKDLTNVDAQQLRAALVADGIALDLKSAYLDAMPDIAPLPERGFYAGLPYEVGR